jgi:hypothetical protein
MKVLGFSYLFISLLVLSCKEKSASYDNLELDNETELNIPRTAEGKSQEDVEVDRKFIKTGTLIFETENLETTDKFIKTLVEDNKAYISQENNDVYNHKTNHTLTIRIPNEKFDFFVDKIVSHAKKTDTKNVSIQDVSEEFVDIEARVRSKKEIEKRYTEILAKANKVEDILKIETELGAIRTEIESIEGRLKWLKNQTTLATLHLTYYKTIEFRSEKPFYSNFINAVSNGWNMLISFLLGIVNVWPFLIIIVVSFYFIRKRLIKR